MHAVVNRLRLAEPLPAETLEAAQRELPPRIARIPEIRSVHLFRVGAEELVLVILADTAEALELMRDEIGNAWMRERVVPHLAGPTERLVGEAVVSYERSA